MSRKHFDCTYNYSTLVEYETFDPYKEILDKSVYVAQRKASVEVEIILGRYVHRQFNGKLSSAIEYIEKISTPNQAYSFKDTRTNSYIVCVGPPIVTNSRDELTHKIHVRVSVEDLTVP